MRETIYADVTEERERQDSLWGEQNHDWPIWSAILSEECGEVAEECLKAHFNSDHIRTNLREELVQVAAVAVHMIEKIDAGS